MIPANYVRFMYIKFNDGETVYVKPHTWSVLDLNNVVDYYSVYLPEDAIELRLQG